MRIPKQFFFKNKELEFQIDMAEGDYFNFNSATEENKDD